MVRLPYRQPTETPGRSGCGAPCGVSARHQWKRRSEPPVDAQHCRLPVRRRWEPRQDRPARAQDADRRRRCHGEVGQIATSNSDGYALTSSGSVWAWGVSSYGELGDGTTVAYDTRAVKVAFLAGVKIHALANPMPFDGALAIDSSAACGTGASTPRATSAFPDS